VNLAEHRHLRLFTFCALYVAQGIPWGFMAYTLPAYVAARGHDISAVGGIAAMTTLPYTLKLVWAPLIDAFPSRRFERRRPWIVFAQAMMVITVAVMIAVPDLTADVTLLAWMIFIHTVFNAMQDVGVDALAVDLLDENERGRTNGAMYASKYLGGMLGGWGMAHLIGWFDLRLALLAQVSVLFAIMLLPILFREHPGEPPQRPNVIVRLRGWGERVFAGRSFGAVLGGAARDRALQSALLGFIVMLGSSVGSGALTAVAPVLFTQELGWDPGDYTSLTSGPGLAVGLGGSILGGFLADKVGHRLLAALGMIGLATGYVVWALLAPYWHNHAIVYATFWIEPLCQSVMFVSLFALCMDISWPQIAATQFAAYMAMINLSSTIGAWVAGAASRHWSYQGLYLVAAGAQVAFIVVLPFIDPRAARSPDRRTPPG
jgi:MFS transporter, PAT family, beta-lactamase induction signal transducer AmpG